MNGPTKEIEQLQADAVSCCPVVSGDPLTDQEAERLARAFAALSDPVRLRLLSLVAGEASGEVCACQLIEPLGRSQPTVSHHLKVLHAAGLLERERRGTWIWYRVVPERLEALRQSLLPTFTPATMRH